MSSKLDLFGRSVSGFIFDFDGVLADSLAAHVKAWHMAVEEIFQCPMSEEESIEIVGRSTRVISKYLCENRSVLYRQQELIDKKTECVLSLYDEISLFSGVHEVFQSLRDQNISFGIASNAPRSFICKILDSKGIKAPIVFGLGDTVRPKPAPDPFLACARAIRLHKCPESVVVFEDSLHGLKAAKKAQMIAVGISSQTEEKKLLEGGADFVFSSVEEALRPILK